MCWWQLLLRLVELLYSNLKLYVKVMVTELDFDVVGLHRCSASGPLLKYWRPDDS